jgi:hypothetical protein
MFHVEQLFHVKQFGKRFELWKSVRTRLCVLKAADRACPSVRKSRRIGWRTSGTSQLVAGQIMATTTPDAVVTPSDKKAKNCKPNLQ